MTNQEALSIVDQLCARAAGSRQDHILAQQALQHLAQALAPKPRRAKPLTKA